MDRLIKDTMANNKEEIYVGLDAGSSKISVAVGKAEDDGTLTVIGAGTSHVSGIKKGTVAEIEETVSGISEAIEIAERICGLPIGTANVSINGNHITSFNSKGVVAVGRADQEVTKNDVARAEDAAQAVQIPANKEIIHVIPRFFTIDGQEPVSDPVGMTGVRLELDAHIITTSSMATKNLNKCLNQAGVRINDLIVAPLASAKAVLTKQQRELGCVLVDLGASTTGLTVFEEDNLVYTTVMPIGAAHVTNDIAIGLRTSIDVAEKVKIKFGYARAKDVAETEKIDLSEVDLKEEGVVTRKYLSEIVEARIEEIFRRIKDELRKIGKDALLPGGVILTGGGAKLAGIEDLAKDVFRLPVDTSKPHSLSGLTEKVYDPRMSTAVGLMLYGFEENTNTAGSSFMPEVVTKIKKVIKIFLP
jgi:cell division protein FtsA